jgi:hypothetical protein
MYLTLLSPNDWVLTEGTIGKLQRVCYVEPEALEGNAICGVLSKETATKIA